MNFIFDVDDTLYNQITPFIEAYTSLEFDQEYNVDIEELFKRSRKYSDEVFGKVSKGLMSIDDSGVYRISKAFLDEGIQIPKEKALKLQQEYRKRQGQIKLSNTMHEILTYCIQHQVTIGVITNGPSIHQQAKVDALQLVNYMPKENILISGNYGINKPEAKLFKICEKQLQIKKEETYYIGDSYENDVIGAKNARWNCIHLNRRNQPLHTDATYIVDSEEEVFELIKQLIK